MNEFAGPILPAWLTVPLAGLTLLVLAVHVLLLHRSAIEPRRRRIRIANGLLMMVTTPLIAYGFSIATPSPQTAGNFVLAWTAIPALLFIIIMLGLFDVLNTLVVHRREFKKLREGFRGRSPQGRGP